MYTDGSSSSRSPSRASSCASRDSTHLCCTSTLSRRERCCTSSLDRLDACASPRAPEAVVAMALALASSAEVPAHGAGIRDCLGTHRAELGAADSSSVSCSTDGSAAGCSAADCFAAGGSFAPCCCPTSTFEATNWAADTDAGATRGYPTFIRGGGRSTGSSKFLFFFFCFLFGFCVDSAYGVMGDNFGLARRCRRRNHHPPPQAHTAQAKSAAEPSTTTSTKLAPPMGKAAMPLSVALVKGGPCGTSGGDRAGGGDSGGSEGGGDDGGSGGRRGGCTGGGLGGRSGGGGWVGG